MKQNNNFMSNLPDTSIIADRLKTEESKNKDYEKICYALSKLGASHYEEISAFLNWSDSVKCARRLKEMLPPTELNPKGKNLIYCTGGKGVTKRNRGAYLYDLIREGAVNFEPERFSAKDEHTADLALTLIQTTLF